MENNVVLAQKGLFVGERVFEVKEGRYLFVRQKGIGQGRDYQIDLLALDPKSRRKLTISWAWLCVALLTLLLIYLFPSVSHALFGAALNDYALFMTIGLAIVAFAAIFMFFSASYLERVYVSNAGRYPLVRLLSGKPERNVYKAFYRQLEAAIQASCEHRGLEAHQRVAGEIKMLRRLVQYDVLSDKQYQAIKARLLK